jgi:DNA repair exonuclease SbcCD ATPase subunit
MGSPAAPSSPPPEAPSGMDELRAKAEKWRGSYRSLTARVAALEADIKRLEELDSRTASINVGDGPRHPTLRTEAERTRERLGKARHELEQARRDLAYVEEGARLDGVPFGMLY